MKPKFRIAFHFSFSLFCIGLPEIFCASTGTQTAPNSLVDQGPAAVQQKRGAADETAKTIKEYTSGCDAGYKLQDEKSVSFSSPFFGSGKSYPKAIKCGWTFVGDDTCQPEIICSDFDLSQSDDCGQEYLEISDGTGGVEKVCGKGQFSKAVRATTGQSDLYVKFVSTVDGTGHKGFKCTARCSEGSVQELKQAEEGKKEDSRCVCGLQNKDDRIVGGEDAKMNEFPWQVAIVTAGTRAPICGGSIINSRYVLTAAHCFYFAKTQPKDIEVLFHARLLDMTLLAGWKAGIALGQTGSIQASGWNASQKTDAQEKTQRFKVVDIIGHPLFTDSYDYDVALLKLDRKIDLAHADAPTPICLPPIAATDSYDGELPWVVGWGLGDQNAGGTTRALQKLAVPVINIDKCQSWTSNKLTDRMLCAGFEKGVKDACTGDSGGPLALKQPNNQWIQIGIVSWGEGCAQEHKPGMYARVTDLDQFVEYHSEGATWCKTTKG